MKNGTNSCTIILIAITVSFLSTGCHTKSDRGEVGVYQSKFIWTGTGEAFVPNYMMIDVLANQREGGSSNDLSQISEVDVEEFIETFMVGHGFNGVHIPVLGQWFHIGNNKVIATDTVIDQATFDKLNRESL